jgi:hypothetical protein
VADESVADESVAGESVSEQELLEALRQLRVSDVLVQTLSTVASLGFHRLEGEERDLEQARLAIETLRAVVPLLAGSVPAELTRDLESVTANLQLAYASAVAPPAGEPA